MTTDVRTVASRLDEQGWPIDPEAAGRLERNLNRTVEGDAIDRRTPFGGEADRQDIDERYLSHLGVSEYEELAHIDEAEVSKTGSESIMLPWAERRNTLEPFRTQKFSGSNTILDQVVVDLSRMFAPSGFRLTGVDSAVDAMTRKTLLGLPDMTSDESFLPRYVERAKDLESAHDIYPAVVGWRGQSKGPHEDPKQRLVWMVDHALIINELRVLYPVLNRLRVLPGYSGWATDLEVDNAVTKLLQTAKNLGEDVISGDISNFDASVPYVLIEAVFDLFRYWFTDDSESLLNILEESFSTMALVTPDGIFSDRKGGVPSGSGLTNLVDTLVNVICARYVARRLRITLVGGEWLGDDSVTVYHPNPGVTEISGALKELGFESNPDKQFVSKDSAHYLQRWHSLKYQLTGVSRGVRSLYRALNGMMSLERYIDTSSERFRYLMGARVIMQLNPCRWNPLFHKFVELAKEDEPILRTGIDPTTVFRRAGGATAIREALHIGSYPFNQQDPDMVEDFASVMVLRELA